MDYSAFIDLNSLTEEVRKELEGFYEYLVFKYRQKSFKKKKKDNCPFEKFLSNPIKSEDFKFLNREERNER
ncbi:MAG: hypothetical protein H8D45_05405 [Bacteroidetes bacterium]|nr:hypothetical protein [Bacteroidota bacterium]MBL7104204.1 hypothetical protein [Bacteroidales bacterium]